MICSVPMQVVAALALLAVLLVRHGLPLPLLIADRWAQPAEHFWQSSPIEDSVVTTDAGPVRGHPLPGSPSVKAAFLGIPYAAPPVGPLRWQPPAPAEPWAPATLPGDSSGPTCIGKPTPGAALSDMDEDCLRLDVYTPRPVTTGPLRPVMVFLHGGDLVEGSSTSVQSGFGAAANVTSLGVVSVVVNYRLAVLGFLALDALAAADVRGVGGNYGLLDCVAALRWVRTNAAAFGGDPARVTVYGQSSGGSLVFALAASPLASGLFRAGVSMSGSPRLAATVAEAAATWHVEAVNRTRCSALARRGELLSCLHSLNKTELVGAMPPDWDSASFSFAGFSPSYRYAPLLLADGSLAVPSDYLSMYRRPDPRSPLAEGATLVMGIMREEIDFAPGDDVRAMTPDGFRELVSAKLRSSFSEAFISSVFAAYGLADPRRASAADLQQLYAQVITDATVYCPSLVLADARAEAARRSPRGGRLYVYSSPQRPGSPAGFCPLAPFQAIPGYCPRYAFHGLDMFGLFAPDWNALSGGSELGYNYTRADRRYGELLAMRFSELAETGAVSAWREYRDGGVRGSGYHVVSLAAPGEANHRDLRSRQCDLWKPLYDKLSLIN
mmetsp:Transcript_10252/g.32357  ORF Transcript_10252/g.32357 Transcript_10252/m.32357 type:complete len:611 (+) Transcript_10252:47-1879(+)